MTATVFVFDNLTRKPIQGALVQLKNISVRTDQNGQATFNLPTPASYSIEVSAPGYQPAGRPAYFGQYSNISDVYLQPLAPQPPGGGGEKLLEDVGTQCAIWERSTSFGTNFVLKKRDGTLLTPGFEDLGRLREKIRDHPECFAPIPPTSGGEGALEKIEKQIQGLADGMADIVGAAEQEALAWRDAFARRFDGLEDWLVERILVILEKALDLEVGRK